MENNKLKHSKLGNTAKKISALCAAGLLFLAPLSAKTNKSNPQNLNPKKQISQMATEDSTAQQNIIDNFEADKIIAVRKNTLSHNFRNLKSKTLTDAEVNAGLAELYTQIIDALMQVANVNHANAIKNLNDSGMRDSMYEYAMATTEEENEAICNKHTNEENLYSRGFYAPTQVETGLLTETCVLNQADEASFNSIDKIDGINEYLKFDVNGPRNVNTEICAVTNWMLTDLRNQIKDTYKIIARQKGSSKEGAEKIGQQKADEFMQYINNINKLIAQDNLDAKSQKELDRNINAAITVMPAQAYGDIKIRKALVNALASIFGIDKIQKNLMLLGYDINNAQAMVEAYQQTANKIAEQNTKKVSNLTVGANGLFGEDLGIINTEINGSIPFNKWNMNLGLEVNPTLYNNKFDNSTQISGKIGAELGGVFANLKAGTEIFYTDGATFILGGDLGVNYQIPNSNIILGAKLGGGYNFNKAFGNINAMLTATFKNHWCNITIGVGYVHIITKDQNIYIPTPPKEDKPTYGTDETTEQQPTDTTNLGDDITEIPDKPVDFTRF